MTLSPLIREVLRECRSLFQRIRMLRESIPLAYHGNLQGNRGHRRENEQTLRCIRDTQHITQHRPLATMLDRQLFVKGWQLGAEWGLGESGNLHQGNSHN